MPSIGQEILAMLDSGPKSMSELYEGVRGKKSSIDKARVRLSKQGKIERVDHGVYQKSTSLGVEIDFSGLSDEEKSNHELNHIGDMMDQTCELVDKMYVGTPVVERLEILSNLLKSAAGFAVDLQSEFQHLQLVWKEDSPDEDIDKIVKGADRVSLTHFVVLLFERWSARVSPNGEQSRSDGASGETNT